MATELFEFIENNIDDAIFENVQKIIGPGRLRQKESKEAKMGPSGPRQK